MVHGNDPAVGFDVVTEGLGNPMRLRGAAGIPQQRQEIDFLHLVVGQGQGLAKTHRQQTGIEEVAHRLSEPEIDRQRPCAE